MYLILAAALGALAAVAAINAIVWLFLRLRLHQHARIIAEAEQLKTVDLSAVIVAHLPLNQRTNIPEEELALAKDAVARKRRSSNRTLLVSFGVLAILIGANAALHTLYTPVKAPVARKTSVGVDPAAVDALAALPGTWGWKFNALLSCKGNPHTISVSSDLKHVSIRFRDPLAARNGEDPVSSFDYDVVDTRPSEVVLRLVDAPNRRDGAGNPLHWVIHFDDRNTYYLKRSDVATQDTGQIVRCAGPNSAAAG